MDRGAGASSATDLTPQEETVIDLISRGLSQREVAAEMFLSLNSVYRTVERVKEKLGAKTLAHAAVLFVGGPTVRMTPRLRAYLDRALAAGAVRAPRRMIEDLTE